MKCPHGYWCREQRNTSKGRSLIDGSAPCTVAGDPVDDRLVLARGDREECELDERKRTGGYSSPSDRGWSDRPVGLLDDVDPSLLLDVYPLV